jgi:phenylalanyl-tRNA synthetase beta chain
MKLSTDLLNQFLSKKLSAEKISETLTGHSFEVELLQQESPEFNNIVAAKVLEVKKHPNADRLRLVRLDAGSFIAGPVVCGAFNFEAGDMVVLALEGAHIPHNIHSEQHEPFTLGKAKIRGIESNGMICASFELGLSENLDEGIMLLNPSIAPGTPLSQLFSSKNKVLQAAAPANRADLHSHWGIAKELSAILDMPVKEQKSKVHLELKKDSGFKISIQQKKFCREYIGIKLSHITVEPSPKEIILLLEQAGIRPVNNVVDITNLALITYGQPLHAFDAKKIEGNIIVRDANPGETITAINHKQYKLKPGMLVIADAVKPLAIAGIIGGLGTEISNETTDIILEAANFSAENIRKTSKELGLRTEASSLFEKNLPGGLTEMAAGFAFALLKKHAGAELEALSTAGSSSEKKISIPFTIGGINKLLGTTFSKSEIIKSLRRFGITVTDKSSKTKESITAVSPWWRNDLQTMPDLAEEVLKLAGFNKIKPQPIQIIPPTNDSEKKITQEIGSNDIYNTKEYWTRLGYTEVQNYNFVSEKDIQSFGETRPHIEVSNPLSEDQRFLKRHLLIPMLKNVALNQKNFGNFKLFEIGKQYLGFENEPMLLTGILFDKTSPIEKLFASAKGDAEQYIRSLGITAVTFVPTDKSWINIMVADTIIGMVGIIDETIIKNFDIDADVAFIKLELEKLLSFNKDVLFHEINRFPKVERDISVVVDSKVTWKEIEDVIASVLGKQGSGVTEKLTSIASSNNTTIVHHTIFEAPFLATEKSTKEYHKKLENEGKKNLGIRLIFENFTRTLTEPEVTGILDKIVLKLQQETKAEIR